LTLPKIMKGLPIVYVLIRKNSYESGRRYCQYNNEGTEEMIIIIERKKRQSFIKPIMPSN
jgi:hypothetical protein